MSEVKLNSFQNHIILYRRVFVKASNKSQQQEEAARPNNNHKIKHNGQLITKTSPYTPLLYSKTGVYRGIQFFLFLL